MTSKEAKALEVGANYWINHSGRPTLARLEAVNVYEPGVNYAYSGRVSRKSTSYRFFKHDTRRFVTFRSPKNIIKRSSEVIYAKEN